MGIGFPETGVPDACELPHGCWELKLSPLLNQSSEPLLQLPKGPPLTKITDLSVQLC